MSRYVSNEGGKTVEGETLRTIFYADCRSISFYDIEPPKANTQNIYLLGCFETKINQQKKVPNCN